MISQMELWSIGSYFLVRVVANKYRGCAFSQAVFVALLATAKEFSLLPTEQLFDFLRKTLEKIFGSLGTLEPDENLLISLNGKDEDPESFVRYFYNWLFQTV